jgi:hypothetical protein
MATPLIEPDAEEDYTEPVADSEDNDDEPDQMRPMYVLALDGRLYKLRPTDGADIAPPRTFEPKTSGLRWESDKVAAVACSAETGIAPRPASWIDPAGKRWTYAVHAGRLEATSDGKHVWRSEDLGPAGPPAIVHGIVFTLTDATLFAFDAATGKPLYASTEGIAPVSADHEIAVANGHIVFNSADGTVYCFGIPILEH